MATRAKSNSTSRLTSRQLRAIARAVSEPRRFDILRHIAAAPKCSACSELREQFPVSAPTLSHHLKELEAAGLIEIVRRGKFIDARFCRETWDAYLAELRSL